jgi:hypothetical protein
MLKSDFDLVSYWGSFIFFINVAVWVLKGRIFKAFFSQSWIAHAYRYLLIEFYPFFFLLWELLLVSIFVFHVLLNRIITFAFLLVIVAVISIEVNGSSVVLQVLSHLGQAFTQKLERSLCLRHPSYLHCRSLRRRRKRIDALHDGRLFAG